MRLWAQSVTNTHEHSYHSFIIGEMRLFFNCVSNRDTPSKLETNAKWLSYKDHAIFLNWRQRTWVYRCNNTHWKAICYHCPHCECVTVFALVLPHPHRQARYHLQKHAAQAIKFREHCEEGAGLFALPVANQKVYPMSWGHGGEDE